MKKYLIKGALALFAGAFLFSCADKETEYVPIVEQKVKAFEDVFKETFGEIDPYQNWGFTNQVILADTSTAEVVYVDSIMSEPYDANRVLTRSENANANEWADPNKAYGCLMVPPPLTDKQIAVVKKYFQITKDPKYEDPKWKNYFIQQVYKGGDDPRTGYSPEKYTAADGTTKLTGSDHMDHLAAIDGTFVDHINNFNHGDCSETNVLDNGSYVNGGKYHKDKIMYMKESTTKSFGYYNSNSSVRRTEYTGLVSYKTIMQALGSEADCLEDGWNRSFMGFDFEMLVDDEIYANNSDGSIKYLTYGDLPDSQYTWDGVSTYGGPRPAAGEFVKDSKGNKIPVLNSSTNMYAGTNGDIDQNQIITSHSCLSGYQYNQATQKDDLPYYQDQNCLNTKVLFDKVEAGYCLVDGSKGCKWVKIGGTADHYYSDWIVTLAEAKKRTSEPEPRPDIKQKRVQVTSQSGRIFCEDLGVSNREDLDFNDVVFDVNVYKYYEEGEIKHYIVYSDGTEKLESTEKYSTEKDATYTCEIILQAAGGTIPITVAGQDVHNAFKKGMTTMINTRDDNTTAFGDFADNVKPVNLGVFLGKANGELTPTELFAGAGKELASKYNSDKVCIEAIDIPIVVNYSNGVSVLGSTLGGAPAKLFVPDQNTKWTVERKPLSLAYPKFAAYVGNKNVKWWDDSDQESDVLERANYYRHSNGISSGNTKSPIVITRFIYPASTEKDLWRGTETYTTWKVKDLEMAYNSFYAGDRIRFYASDLKDDSYITVVYADGSKPYFIDASFPNFKVDNKGGLILDANGKKIPVTSGVIEVVLDEQNAEKMTATVQQYRTLQVQGRSITLKSIGIVPFK